MIKKRQTNLGKSDDTSYLTKCNIQSKRKLQYCLTLEQRNQYVGTLKSIKLNPDIQRINIKSDEPYCQTTKSHILLNPNYSTGYHKIYNEGRGNDSYAATGVTCESDLFKNSENHDAAGSGSIKELNPIQRNAANARERARMRVLSKAFVRLKTTLPWVPADTKLSKLDTLRLASSYIAHLRSILVDDDDSLSENCRTQSVDINEFGGAFGRNEDFANVLDHGKHQIEAHKDFMMRMTLNISSVNNNGGIHYIHNKDVIGSEISYQDCTGISSLMHPLSLIKPKIIPHIGRKIKMYFNYNTELPREELIVSTNRLYNILTTQIDYKKFFYDLKLSDTLYSWYSVTGLHIWMVFVRLATDPTPCPILGIPLQDRSIMRRILTVALTRDLENKIKVMGVRGRLKKDALHEIWGHFQFCHFDYDAGLLGSDKELAASLWRTFYGQSSNLNTMAGFSQIKKAHTPDTPLHDNDGDVMGVPIHGIIPEVFDTEDPTLRLVTLIEYVRKTVMYLDTTNVKNDLLKGTFQLPKLT